MFKYCFVHFIKSHSNLVSLEWCIVSCGEFCHCMRLDWLHIAAFEYFLISVTAWQTSQMKWFEWIWSLWPKFNFSDSSSNKIGFTKRLWSTNETIFPYRFASNEKQIVNNFRKLSPFICHLKLKPTGTDEDTNQAQ